MILVLILLSCWGILKATVVPSCSNYEQFVEDAKRSREKTLDLNRLVIQARADLDASINQGHKGTRLDRHVARVRDLEERLNHWSMRVASLKPRIRLKLVDCIHDLMKEIRRVEILTIQKNDDNIKLQITDLRRLLNRYLTIYEMGPNIVE